MSTDRMMEIESSGSQSINRTKKDIRNYKQGLDDDHKEIYVELLTEIFFF